MGVTHPNLVEAAMKSDCGSHQFFVPDMELGVGLEGLAWWPSNPQSRHSTQRVAWSSDSSGVGIDSKKYFGGAFCQGMLGL